MDDLWSQLDAYERDTLVLRLDKRETSALIALLIDVSLSHHLKAEAVLLADKLGSEYCEHLPKKPS
jgi:hypothetical protein